MATVAIGKFNDNDRRLVVNSLQQIWGIRLEHVPNISPRLFRVSKRRECGFILIFGGKDDWHGIKENQINDIIQAYDSMYPDRYFRSGIYGNLILANKNHEKIDIFCGRLDYFLSNKDKLIRNYANDYQFHHERIGNFVRIKEIPNFYMEYLTSVPLSNFENGIDTVFEATEDITQNTKLIDISEALKKYSIVSPPGRTEQVIYRVIRNPRVARLVKESKGYVCEICERKPFMQKNGKLYGEADHIKPLGGEYGGIDAPNNMRCLCAQCHAVITHGSDEEIQELLKNTKWR